MLTFNTAASARRGGVTQSGFVAFQQDGTNSSSDTRSYATTLGTVDVTVSSKNTSDGIDGVFHRGGLTNSGAFTFANIYNDFAYDNGASTADILLSLSGPGISANTSYELTFYSFDPLSTQGNHTVSITPTSGTTGAPLMINWTGGVAPTSNLQYAATGIFQADAAGALNFSLLDNFSGQTESAGVRLNAFEIAELTVIPEPGALSIWVLAGCLALVCWRSRMAFRN